VAGGVPGDPKTPYPIGNPPSAEDERLRAMGLPREGEEADAAEEADARRLAEAKRPRPG
jgi:hypothetical protein